MLRHILWIPLCALLLALGVPVDAQQPKKIARLGYLAAVSAAADAPRRRHFGKVYAISATLRDRTFSLSSDMRAAVLGGFPSLQPSWWSTSPTSLWL